MATAVGFDSRLDGLARDRRELDALEAEWLVRVGDYARSREWQTDGFLSPAAALRKRCRMTYGTAAATVQLAKRLEQLPATLAAFSSGSISRQHAKIIADAYTPERTEKLGDVERIFAETATRVDPKDLADVVKVTIGALDGDGGAADDAKEYDRNRLHVSPLSGRGVLDGSLDGESAEIVMAALDAMQAQLRLAGDKRRRSAKQADALVEICRRSLAHDHTKTRTRRRGRPHLSVVVDLRDHEAAHPELIGEIRAEAEHVGQLSRTTLERLSCDCQISRIITDGPSQIIDVGRTTRNISDKLWNALVARDRHCTEPGCEHPPGWCEAHHIWHWEHGGPTNLDNLRLLCWHHHRQQHLHDAQARARPG